MKVKYPNNCRYFLENECGELVSYYKELEIGIFHLYGDYTLISETMFLPFVFSVFSTRQRPFEN